MTNSNFKQFVTRWLFSTNCKDIAMCGEWAVIWKKIWSNLCGISDKFKILYQPWGIGVESFNKYSALEADTKCHTCPCLSKDESMIKGVVWYGYVKKLDTIVHLWVEVCILRRISRYIEFIVRWQYRGSSNYLKEFCSFSEKLILSINNIIDMLLLQLQGPKSLMTVGFSKEDSILKTEESSEPLDVTAELPKVMRTRSSHSRIIKEINQDNPKGNSKDTDRKLMKVSAHTVRTFINSRLVKYTDDSNRFNGIIRILADPIFLEYCYILIKSKPGNSTKGVTSETLDGVSQEWFKSVCKDLMTGKYNFTPARRVNIPKANGKMRPLGIGSPREKIIQKGLAMILETIWEPKFLNCSFGFRPKRSTHSALKVLYMKGHHHSWVIQGDITKCFDSIPHEVIMNILNKYISDERFLTIIRKSLKVGYIDSITKKLVNGKIGTPQGSIISPILCNIVLHELDTYMMDVIVPEFTKGRIRATNPVYNKLIALRSNRLGVIDSPESKKALDLMRLTPRYDHYDPNWRRTMFVRYADDFVILFEGPKSEALLIRDKVEAFLKESCGLELNMTKTHVTNLLDGFKFLGADIMKTKSSEFRVPYRWKGKIITKRINARLRVLVPIKDILKKLLENKFVKRNLKGEWLARPLLRVLNKDHATIIQFFNSKILGLITYYSFAANRVKLLNILWLLKYSLAKTLALKFKLSSARQAFKKFGPNLKDPETGLEFKTIHSLPTIHHYNNNIKFAKLKNLLDVSWSGNLTKTNLFKSCVICGSTKDIEMHHLRSVKKVRSLMKSNKATFAMWMGGSLRKQIPLCNYHHKLYHKGQLLNYELNRIALYNENVKVNDRNIDESDKKG